MTTRASHLDDLIKIIDVQARHVVDVGKQSGQPLATVEAVWSLLENGALRLVTYPDRDSCGFEITKSRAERRICRQAIAPVIARRRQLLAVSE